MDHRLGMPKPLCALSADKSALAHPAMALPPNQIEVFAKRRVIRLCPAIPEPDSAPAPNSTLGRESESPPEPPRWLPALGAGEADVVAGRVSDALQRRCAWRVRATVCCLNHRPCLSVSCLQLYPHHEPVDLSLPNLPCLASRQLNASLAFLTHILFHGLYCYPVPLPRPATSPLRAWGFQQHAGQHPQ